MRRYFLNFNDDDKDLFIGGSDFHHIKNVLRLNLGDKLEVVSYDKLFTCQIDEFLEDKVKLTILEKKNLTNKKLKIRLFQALAKGEKLDFICQKATELGADEIIIFESSRTVVKLDKKRLEKKLERLNKITIEASKQCKRNKIPLVKGGIDIKEIEGENLFCFYENSKKSLKDFLYNKNFTEINIIIGPEGGFSEEEIEILRSKGAEILSLGPRILRTETAGLAAIAISQYELGDMGE
ncbi:RsmE family RNA methyltransferase [Citroniella saccharovorans]|uniref:Ribosomal RNA small subunit methyltransferase E n=1 Tax=Citroniella saccharovorans TaxID=2053367 RepID=A0AAW9MS07_9FIRM|nr:RsmE family RNA methyltransferase [Citroniella saccharovorans]MEB3429919.1 RsmE family RNA methyltransferase [Citroniella saccharovorans]